MKTKKQETLLIKELERIKQSCICGLQIKATERKMNDLIQRALEFYRDEVNPQMAQFYFQYGSVLLQLLEQKDCINYEDDKDELAQNNYKQVQGEQLHNNQIALNINPAVQKENDGELKDAQVAFENLEASRQIIQTQINKLQTDYEELQQRMIKIREQKQIWQISLARTLKRVADLHSWREEFNDALEQYEKVVGILENFKTTQMKEISEVYYKIGNVQLLQGASGCEQKAFQNLQNSLKLCIETQQLKLPPYDLNTSRGLYQLKKYLKQLEQNDQIVLLILLVEKMEDTLQQLKESQECSQEIEKWKKTNFSLNGQINEFVKANNNQFNFIGTEKKDFQNSPLIPQRPDANNFINGSLSAPLQKPTKFLGVFGSAAKMNKTSDRLLDQEMQQPRECERDLMKKIKM